MLYGVKTSLTRKVSVSLVVAMALFLSASALTYHVAMESQVSEQELDHSHNVRELLQRLLSSAQDIETGGRGFALSGRESFLAPYESGKQRVQPLADSLARLVADLPNQRGHLAQLTSLLQQQPALVDSLVAMRRSGGANEAKRVAMYESGKQAMDRLRDVIAEMDEHEQRLLALRASAARASTRRLLGTIVLGNLLALLLLSSFAWFIRRDIRARVLAEAALADSENRMRLLLDSVNDHAILMLDPSGAVSSWNDSARRVTGFEHDEILGEHVSLLYMHEDAAAGAPARDLIDAEAYVKSETQGWRAHRSGSRYWANVTTSSIWNDLGDLEGYAMVIRDVTTRKEAEALVAQQNTLLESILASIGDGVVAIDTDGDYAMYNPAARRIVGLGTAAAPAGEWANSCSTYLTDANTPFPSDEMPLVLALRGQTPTGVEMFVRPPDAAPEGGSWISCTARPLRDERGTILGAVMAIQDVSQKRHAEQALRRQATELERSNAELQQFAYVASHDLQEPLRMVASYTQLLAKRYQGRLDSQADEFIGFAVDGATRMQRLISDLLLYSRVGTRGKEPRATCAEAALDLAVANLQAAIQESGATVCHVALPTVLADETQLAQLFQNLIANAIKFRGASAPLVQIAAEHQPDGDWHFSVRDNGIGIEPQYFERIFGMFQRLHTTAAYPGSGIGLAICKRIVERLGGRMWLESVAGEGSTFHFTLPAVR